jgi:NAD(P)-dependent dehydrogenase (short-subunit alcohol dehydrogenase family)
MSPGERRRSPVALVTGAGSGIGRAISKRLSDAGYQLILTGRRAQALEATLSELGHVSGSFVVPTDITDPRSIEKLFAQVSERARRLDVLINNAGILGPAAPIEDYPLQGWEAVVQTNLTGAFLCAQKAFCQMREQQPPGGRIINNGSLSAHVPRPDAAAYTVTKHGMTGLTKALALEGRRHGIACGQIDIGNAASEMTRGVSAGALQPDGSRLAEPTMEADDVADAVLYMVNLPLEANVLSMTVMATGMPFMGRG